MTQKATRRSFLKVTSMGMAASIALPGIAASKTDKSNIVVISLDDSGFADFSPFGNPSYPAPNVQKLAGKGCCFTNFHLPQVPCSTTCGMHPQWASIAESLKPQGYTSGVFGKGHIEHAVDFIKCHSADPFFLCVPHLPLFASEEFENRSGEGLYADMMMEVDGSVGAITNALRDAGIDKNTLVIFISHNGPWISNDEHTGTPPLPMGWNLSNITVLNSIAAESAGGLPVPLITIDEV